MAGPAAKIVRALRGGGLGLLLFPVMLWVVGTMFYGGSLGLQQDDWTYVLRDPESGRYGVPIITHWMHFFRPLYRVIVPVLWTLFYDHDWVVHLISALVHAGCSWSIYRLCKALGGCTLAAMAGALVYLVYPVHEQAYIWPTAMPTTLANWIAVEALILYVSRLHHGDERCKRFRSVAVLSAMLFLAALVVMSLNEQPVMLLLAAPLLGLIGLPGRKKSGEGPPRRAPLLRRAFHAAVVGGAIALAIVLYMVVHRFTSGTIETGNGSAVPLERLPERLTKFKEELVRRLILEETAKGALMRCRDAVTEHTRTAGVLGVFLLASFVPWWRALWSRRHEAVSARAGWVMLLVGASLFILTWMPVARVWYYMSSRLHAPPMVGLAVAVCGVVTLAGRLPWGGARGAAYGLCAGMGALASVAFALMLVGVQWEYDRRWDRDRMELTSLVRLVPDPPPGTIFVPEFVAHPAPTTGQNVFDFDRRNVFVSGWSATPALQLTFGRRDITCTWTDWGHSGVVLVERDVEGAVTRISTPSGEVDPAVAVLFIVDQFGNVELSPGQRVPSGDE